MLNWIFIHVIQAENVNSTTRLVSSSVNISIINFYKSFGFYMYYITSSQLHHIKCLNCIIITGLYLSKRKIKWKVMHIITEYRKMILHWAECFYRKRLIILELAQNQNHVSEWNEMLPYKNPTKRVGLELKNCLLYIIKQQSLTRFQQKIQLHVLYCNRKGHIFTQQIFYCNNE